MGKSDKVIAFRLSPDALEQAEEAAERRSVTVNELANMFRATHCADYRCVACLRSPWN